MFNEFHGACTLSPSNRAMMDKEDDIACNYNIKEREREINEPYAGDQWINKRSSNKMKIIIYRHPLRKWAGI